LVAWAWDKWALPLYVENDARLALLGEWQFGAGRGCENIVMVTLGTGIGSAVLIEGKLLRGKHFQAGNLCGHLTMIHAFDPEMIIISGGIIKSGSVIMPELQSRINQFAWTPWGKVKLVEAQYPDSAALFGAYYMV